VFLGGSSFSADEMFILAFKDNTINNGVTPRAFGVIIGNLGETTESSIYIDNNLISDVTKGICLEDGSISSTLGHKKRTVSILNNSCVLVDAVVNLDANDYIQDHVLDMKYLMKVSFAGRHKDGSNVRYLRYNSPPSEKATSGVSNVINGYTAFHDMFINCLVIKKQNSNGMNVYVKKLNDSSNNIVFLQMPANNSVHFYTPSSPIAVTQGDTIVIACKSTTSSNLSFISVDCYFSLKSTATIDISNANNTLIDPDVIDIEDEIVATDELSNLANLLQAQILSLTGS